MPPMPKRIPVSGQKPMSVSATMKGWADELSAKAQDAAAKKLKVGKHDPNHPENPKNAIDLDDPSGEMASSNDSYRRELEDEQRTHSTSGMVAARSGAGRANKKDRARHTMSEAFDSIRADAFNPDKHAFSSRDEADETQNIASLFDDSIQRERDRQRRERRGTSQPTDPTSTAKLRNAMDGEPERYVEPVKTNKGVHGDRARGPFEPNPRRTPVQDELAREERTTPYPDPRRPKDGPLAPPNRGPHKYGHDEREEADRVLNTKAGRFGHKGFGAHLPGGYQPGFGNLGIDEAKAGRDQKVNAILNKPHGPAAFDEHEGTQRHTVAPPGYEHVIDRLKGREGVDAYAIAWAMKDREDEETERHAETLESIDFVPGCFSRNLKILDGIAAGRYRADRQVIDRAADDALADVSRHFEHDDAVGNAWRVVLETARHDAHGKTAKYNWMTFSNVPRLTLDDLGPDRYILNGAMAICEKKVAPVGVPPEKARRKMDPKARGEVTDLDPDAEFYSELERVEQYGSVDRHEDVSVGRFYPNHESLQGKPKMYGPEDMHPDAGPRGLKHPDDVKPGRGEPIKKYPVDLKRSVDPRKDPLHNL